MALVAVRKMSEEQTAREADLSCPFMRDFIPSESVFGQLIIMTTGPNAFPTSPGS